MSKLYNTQKDIATNIRDFFINNTDCLHKPQLKFLPFVIFAIIISESLVASDISSSLKDEFSFVQIDSISKRFRRLMSNSRFLGHTLFNQIVKYIISNYKKKHDDKRVHLVIDHMYSKENYTILMISMRIGKQGIPIWFKSFKGINIPDAYFDSLLIDAINDVHNLFINSGLDLIFLADRWFNSYNFLKHIDSLGHYYVVRLKGGINIRYFDKREGHKLRRKADDLFAYNMKAAYYENIELFEDFSLTVNIVRSKRKGVKEPWILVTNGDPKRAIKDYGYRYGAIETIFKNQKSNGFYLEDIVNASPLYFDNLYSTLCICILLCTCLGIEYSKNSKCYKNVHIQTQKYTKDNSRIRVKSIFSTGLTLFKLAYNSSRYIRLPITFILYDI